MNSTSLKSAVATGRQSLREMTAGRPQGRTVSNLVFAIYPIFRQREGSHANRCTIIANHASPGKSSLDRSMQSSAPVLQV